MRALLQATVLAAVWAAVQFFVLDNSATTALIGALVVLILGFLVFLLIGRSRSTND